MPAAPMAMPFMVPAAPTAMPFMASASTATAFGAAALTALAFMVSAAAAEASVATATPAPAVPFTATAALALWVPAAPTAMAFMAAATAALAFMVPAAAVWAVNLAVPADSPLSPALAMSGLGRRVRSRHWMLTVMRGSNHKHRPPLLVPALRKERLPLQVQRGRCAYVMAQLGGLTLTPMSVRGSR